MNLRRLFIFLSLILLLPLAVPGAAHADAAIKGVYTEVPGARFKFDGKTVEVMEFMSFYCSHCYAFEKDVPVIKGNFPKRIKWRVMPVYWGSGASVPGEAYLLAEDAGKGEQMKKALFNASFRDKADIGRYEVVEALAMQIGLGFDFSRRLRSGEKAQQARDILMMAREYGVDGTPTFIIAGNLKATTETFGHDTGAIRDNVMTIVKSVLDSKGSK